MNPTISTSNLTGRKKGQVKKLKWNESLGEVDLDKD